MPHLNARSTQQARLDLVLEVAAKQLHRYRDEGWDGLFDRCSSRHLTVPPAAAGGTASPRTWAWRPRPPAPSSAGPVSTAATGGAG